MSDQTTPASISGPLDYFYETLIPKLSDKLDSFLCSESAPSFCTREKLLHNEPIALDIEQVHHLHSYGFSWKSISQLLGISQSTLYRRRKEAGITDELKFSDISDEELIDKVREIRQSLPYSGERILSGSLRSAGIIVPRQRLRNVIHWIDPVSTTLRWRPRIKRKPYRVPGPMSLWHIGKIII